MPHFDNNESTLIKIENNDSSQVHYETGEMETSDIIVENEQEGNIFESSEKSNQKSDQRNFESPLLKYKTSFEELK